MESCVTTKPAPTNKHFVDTGTLWVG